ncbi:MAG: hypothetical protein JXQ27_06755 [Acidobacteria bacterium]|nr:hypothetical protein [Acidobacteriota bacterium]
MCKRLTMLLTITAGLAGFVLAQGSSFPTAAEILDRYTAVTGGKAAYDRLGNRVTESTVSIPTAEMEILMATTLAKMNLVHIRMEAEAMGKMESGSNGDVAWDLSAGQGARRKTGPERRQFLFMNVMDRHVYWRSLYQAVDLLGTQEVEGKTCWRVKAMPAVDIAPEELYFDQASGLLAGLATALVTPSGPVPVRFIYEDYRDVDGIRLPFRSRIQVMEEERILSVRSIRHNVELTGDPFRLPPEVQALVEKESDEDRKSK